MLNAYSKKITIKSESGYVLVSEAYREKLELSPSMLSYVYSPYVELEENAPKKWMYYTHSKEFDRAYEEIEKIAAGLPDSEDEDLICDLGKTSLEITYDKDLQVEKETSGSSDDFNRILDLIRSVIPFGENVWPVFLREHYEEEEKTAG